MRGTLTIAAREVRERTFVLVTALIPALTPFVVAIWPNRGTNPREGIIVVGAVGAAGLTLGLAILLGASVVGRDLADRRLSFYFSKPVSASAIWFGKIAGAVATIAVCFAITFLPAFVVAHNQWQATWGLPLPLVVSALFAIAISLIMISHAGSTIIRSRSPLVALDVALLAASGVVTWWLIRPLLANGAVRLGRDLGVTIGFMVPVAILAGGAWQLSRGRTDIRRSHRELSKFFWTVMIVTIAAAGLFVAWVFAAGPSDIKIDGASGNASADWLAISGPAAHRLDYRPAFLVDMKTGHSVRVPASGYLNGSAEFTHRGNAFVTVSVDRDIEHFVARVYRLGPSSAELLTQITIPAYGSAVASDDLTRLATFEFGSRVLSVYDIPSKTIVGSVKIPFDGFAEVFFASDDIVRIYARDYRGLRAKAAQEMRIFEFNAKAHQIVQTGAVTADAVSIISRVSADGSTLVVSQYGPAGSRIRLLDGRTGVERGAIAGPGPLYITPLSDGGAAYVAWKKGSAASLRVTDSHGVVAHDVTLPAGIFGGVREIVQGQKYLASVSNGDRRESGAGWTLCVVDVQRGLVERVERNFVLRTLMRGYDPRVPAPNPSGEFVVADANNALWRWNALTGAKSKIF
jgi:hypothetical protein